MASRSLKLSLVTSLAVVLSLTISTISCPYAEEKQDCSNPVTQTDINICSDDYVQTSLELRQKQLSLYKSHWSPDAKNAFQQFEQARNQFIRAHLDNETDWPIGSSGRPATINAEHQALIEDELNFLARFEQGQFPAMKDSDFDKQDKQLNIVYKTIQTRYKEPDPATGVSHQSVKKTQRIWLRYRDAWCHFAQIHYPAPGVQSWKAFITEKRVAMLNAIAASFQP